MVNKRGNRITTRKAEKGLTRNTSSLTDAIKKLLILDLETFPEDTPPAEICKHRRIYGSPQSKLQLAVARRIRKLREVKERNESLYW